MSILRKNIDSNPYSGTRKVTGKLRLSTASWLDGYFNNSNDYTQVTGVTRGKEYEVVCITGIGDVEDVTIINDNGEQQTLCDFFFEEIT